MKSTLFIICFYITYIKTFPPNLNPRDQNFVRDLIKMATDVIHDSSRYISMLQTLRKQNSDYAAYEIGYVTHVIQDKYRRMVDMYESSTSNKRQYYIVEHILYLQDIERIYWEITHLTNMLHETERKFGKISPIYVNYDDFEAGIVTKATTTTKFVPTRKTTTLFVNKYILEGKWSTRRKPRKRWFPFDYDAHNSLQILRPQDKIINELSWGTKLKIFKDLPGKPQRRVGLSFLRTPEDILTDVKSTKSLATTAKSVDSSMKMKLFRLMYETVRDSDLKVKRAELIKVHYSNYSTFEIGFIMGDITDKLNVMTDISLTLKRLYGEWKPMEHINAYEQIANKGIEISHLIDIVRIINKRNPANTMTSSSDYL